jgi:TrkA domain protein
MADIHETDLPGIGRKFQILTQEGEKLVIIIHDDGIRELFHFDADDPDESISMVTLNDLEARQVAGILGGMSYKPKELETAEVTLDQLHIEWYKIKRNSPYIGKTIGELEIRKKSGATIIAVIEKNRKQTITPGADYVLQADATLVVAGEKKNIKAFKQILQGEND